MTTPTSPRGIELHTVQTTRLRTAFRAAGDLGAPVLVLLHGNVSSSAFFEHLMTDLIADFRIVAPDFRGYGDSERKAIDGTRGVADLSDDTAALLDALGIEGPVDVLGWSAGGNVALQLAIDHPGRVRRLVLEAPGSPFGFGGSTGLDGRPVADDFAGSGGGTVNPQFVQALLDGDRGEEAVSPRTTLRSFYVKPGFTFAEEDEEAYVDAMLKTSVGDDVYPGDRASSENWPGVAPGRTGMNNALSPKYLRQGAFADLDPAPPVLWIRGDADQIVSDTSMFDMAQLGKLGALPGYPGEEVCPTQPMVSQMRTVLEAAGNVTEVVYEDTGHSPHLEQRQRFVDDVRSLLRA
ncbi:alpha/beta fold hydrolase [Ornithinimicrobium sufpigmenti]|uniref:alpha/beta fold hydrolase n=1 Tax=Ornithinimicrobium sufpigmenti TaxID=2508882 RepID=UPI0010355C19|nr:MULTISPECIES: alpha/beta hydrolase [unclassified Ornithinimicrobium]